MTLDDLRAQAQIYQYVVKRDRPKRYVSVHILLYGCFLGGYVWASVAFWLGVTIVEFSIAWFMDRTPATARMSTARLYTYLAASLVLSVLYFAPAVLLAVQPDFGLYTFGLIWVLAALAGLSTMYHPLPAFFWSSTCAGFITAVLVLLAGFRTEFSTGNPQGWWLALGLLCMHIVNTVRLVWDYRDTQKELETTRAQSLVQLRRLEHLSTHDGLTDLLNRTAFDTGLAEQLEHAKPGHPVAMILIDLNGFKPINDTYGHEAGDAVIVAVGNRLAKFVGSNGIVARLGGDEFAIMLPPGMGETEIKGFGSAISAHVREPIIFRNAVIRISASVGIAFSGETLARATELYAAADQAMYRAKANGDDTPVLYHADMFPPRPTLEDKARIESALRTGEIGPHYQMKIAIDTGEIRGFEALARWQHPERGTLSPGHFINDIVNLGLMPELTYWMLRQVLSDVSGWLDEGLDPGRVAVNIPEIALATQNGREDLDWLLAEYETCRGHITFEITEDVVIARSGDIIKTSIEHFSESGITISLDDFGTGFASFQHLQQLTFDEMKIDTSFVAGLGTDPVADVIVEGFMLIARGLGVDIIAEGVETEAQLAHLRRLGCTYAQGYYFSRAVPPMEARGQLIESIRARQPGRRREVGKNGGKGLAS